MNPDKNIGVFQAPAENLREKLSIGKTTMPSIPTGLVMRKDNSLVSLKADYKDWVADDINRMRKISVTIHKIAGAGDKIIRDIGGITLNLKILAARSALPWSVRFRFHW